MRRSVTPVWFALICMLFTPLAAFAQLGASVTGVVKDASGAVLPGVTVEVSSPALIEKVRSAVSDGNGVFQVVDLRPGTYSVTFTLAGFNTVRREPVELSGTATVIVNADLPVGSLEETVTVSGEAPVVDVQSSVTQRVIDREVVDFIPTSRTQQSLTALIPGMNTTQLTHQDVGGQAGDRMTDFSIHGSRVDDQRQMVNGLSIGGVARAGQATSTPPSMTAMAEVTIDTSGVDASQPTGGVRINFIPRDGGNRFSGTMFLTGATGAMQGSNYTDELAARGLRSIGKLKKVIDVNPGVGGPIKRDRLWFYFSLRDNPTENYIAGGYHNLNENRPDLWTYEPDLSRPSINDYDFRNQALRLTWQATSRHKIAGRYDNMYRCTCPSIGSFTTSPEAAPDFTFKPIADKTVEWTGAISSRLLMEGIVFHHQARWLNVISPLVDPRMIPVTEQNPRPGYPTTYRSRTSNHNFTPNWRTRFSLSYVTGAHAFRTGMNHGWSTTRSNTSSHHPMSYRLSNGVPNQLTLNSYPVDIWTGIDGDGGVFAQDKWTIDRLTLNLGVRYDYFLSAAPETRFGPTPLLPARDFTFPRTPLLSWHDVTPKVGAAFDLSGDGKTALKVSANKYVAGQAGGGLANVGPANNVVTTTTRSWTDANGNYVPDCDLTNATAQDLRAGGGDFCGAWASANFGQAQPGTTQDPDVMRGWGKRGWNWEFSTSIQREIVQRVSVDVGYFRRVYGNFTVTDNLTLSPSDYDPYSITAPVDPRLPGGGGYAIGDLYNLNPSRFGLASNNYVTFAGNYGRQIEHWNGVDVTATGRLANGFSFSGGLSTGRSTSDECDVAPKLDNPSRRFCRQIEPFLTQVKGFGSYQIPRVDVNVAATFQSIPGPSLQANFTATNAMVQPSLGRPLSGGATNVSVALLEPNTIYGDRLSQVDVRVGKLFRINRMRTMASVDVFNVTNANPVLAESSTYSQWRTPTTILSARFVKLSLQLDF
jgi:hypothetical protein